MSYSEDVKEGLIAKNRETTISNKDLRDVIDKSFNAGYEECKRSLMENNTIDGEIVRFYVPDNDATPDEDGEGKWCEVISMNYDRKEFDELVFGKMKLKEGDKVKITITKA